MAHLRSSRSQLAGPLTEGTAAVAGRGSGIAWVLLPMLMGAMGGGGGLGIQLSGLGGGIDRGALNRGILNPPSMMHRVEGSASIDVNVSAPPGTRVEGKSAGLFKPIQMSRQVQMAHTAQGPSGVAGGQFGRA